MEVISKFPLGPALCIEARRSILKTDNVFLRLGSSHRLDFSTCLKVLEPLPDTPGGLASDCLPENRAVKIFEDENAGGGISPYKFN